MHIEFRLPNGAGGMAAAHYAHKIKQRLAQWSTHNNSIRYTLWTFHRSHSAWVGLRFEDEETYTLFALTWDDRDLHMTPKWVLAD